LHIAQTDKEITRSHFNDPVIAGIIEESFNERYDSLEKTRHKLSEIEEDICKQLQDKYNQIQSRLGELVNQRYGIKEIEQLNAQIHASRVKKIHVGLLMRAVKSQDYSKISEDFKEVEAVTKMTQIWGSIEKPLKELLTSYKESKKP
jgi:predicted nuclease with TOPRIM domain